MYAKRALQNPKYHERNINGLSAAQTEALAILLGECSATAEVAARVLHHGYRAVDRRTTLVNAEVLHHRLADVLVAMEWLQQTFGFSIAEVHRIKRDKLSKKQQLHHIEAIR